MNKNEIYLIGQPKRVTLALVYFPSGFDIDTDTANDNLFKLTEVTDSVFVFTGDETEYDLDKFASLYGACGWMVQEGSPTASFIKLLTYSKEIFQTHTSFVVVRQEELEKTQMNGEIEAISQAILSEITQPVLKIRRLRKEELKEIYLVPKIKRRGWLTGLFGDGVREEKGNNKFATWTVSSLVPFFKMPTVNQILGVDREWSDTFDFGDLRYFLGSFLKREAAKYMNKDLSEICQPGNKKEEMTDTRQL